MNTSELSGPNELSELFGGGPPALGDCLLFSVHIDERDTSVTLGFETRELPTRPKAEWAGTVYNTFVFSVLFPRVAGLSLRGILAEEHREVSLTPAPEGRIAVSVTGPHRSLEFTAAGARVVGTAVRLQGGL
ncbi:Imm50 family immunity protein [Streptomyces sp. NPDC051211]|uniref:Imm50 family immunity protein n=1 Tax=Streptomyces sp. NPDC051211 TaxID=3154643 RepID=UPI0034505665